MRSPSVSRAPAARPGFVLLALALALGLAGSDPAAAEELRVRTSRGTFLVEVTDPGLVARAEGDELVLSRPGGDEVRLRLNPQAPAAGSDGPVLSIRRDGKVLATARLLAEGPREAGAIGLNAKTPARAWSAAMSPDGKTLVTGHEGSIRAWDAATLAPRWNVATGKTVRRISFTADGATIATAEWTSVEGKPVGNVVIRDAATGEARKVMKPSPALHCVSISPSGEAVVSSSWLETDIRVWDASTGDQVGTLTGHTGAVGTVVYSPDGKTLASCGDRTVRLWDADTGKVKRVLRGHSDSLESLAFSGDGKTLASGGFDGEARAWEVESGRLLATLKCGDPVLAVALTSDGQTVATAAARWGKGFYGQAPGQVRVWSVANGDPVATLPPQPAQVFALAFGPDGKSLFTAGLSGAVTSRDVASAAPPARPSEPKPSAP